MGITSISAAFVISLGISTIALGAEGFPDAVDRAMMIDAFKMRAYRPIETTTTTIAVFEPRRNRDDLCHVKLANGSKLSIRTALHTETEQDVSEVFIVLHPERMVNDKEDYTWATALTTTTHVSAAKPFYALVKEVGKQLFIFCLWNGRHFIIDKENGRIDAKGEGDDALTEYVELTPLRLMVNLPSRGRTLSPQELEERTRVKSKQH
jgi:hypothetical protein